MPKSDENTDRIIAKLDEVKSLLEDLLIIEGIKAGVARQDLRKAMGIGMNRVTVFSKVFDNGKKKNGEE